jgi:hypothetical protein
VGWTSLFSGLYYCRLRVETETEKWLKTPTRPETTGKAANPVPLLAPQRLAG